MKKTLSILLLLLISIIACQTSGYACGKITGAIDYNGQKNGNIIIATLSIPPDFENPIRLDTLNAPGQYVLEGIDKGTYFIGAYLDINENNIPGYNEPIGIYPSPITVDGTELTENINFSLDDLPRGLASISGKITYSIPITGDLHIYAFGTTITPFNSAHSHWGENDNKFSIGGLSKGNYVLVAYIDKNGNKLPDLDEPMGAIREPVELAQGQRINDLEIILADPPQSNSSLSGNVTYFGIKPGKIHVIMGGLSFTPYNETLADSVSGAFNFCSLAKGRYIIFSFVDENCNGYFDLGEPFSETYMNKIHVDSDQAINGIDIEITDTGSCVIKGNVSYGGAQQGFIITAALGLSATPVVLNPMMKQGDYTIAGVAPGIYMVGGYMNTNDDFMPNLGEPMGFYLDDFIYLTPGDTAKGIDFTLEDETNSAIAGHIYKPDGLSGDVHIIALGLSISPFKYLKVTDSDNYQIDNMGSGKYLIAAYMDVNNDGLYNIDEPIAFIKRPVNVFGNTVTENIDLVLAPREILINDVVDNSNKNNLSTYALTQNYPNPFNPSTAIKFELPEESHVSIKIYNLMGEEITTLIDGKISAGTHELIWDTKNISGKNISSGIYIYKMVTNNFVCTRKMTLIR